MKPLLVLPVTDIVLPRPGPEEAPYEERTIHIRTTPAAETLQLLADVAEAATGGDVDSLVDAVRGGDLVRAIARVFLRSGSARFQVLLDRLLRHTSVTYQRQRIELGTREAFDVVFSGELQLLVDVVMEVTKQMFASFFRGQRRPETPPAR